MSGMLAHGDVARPPTPVSATSKRLTTLSYDLYVVDSQFTDLLPDSSLNITICTPALFRISPLTSWLMDESYFVIREIFDVI